MQIEGGVLVSKGVKEVIPFNEKGFNGEIIAGVTTHYNKVSKVIERKHELSYDTYEFFQSLDGCPSSHSLSEWKRMSAKERLAANIKQTAAHFDAISYTFHVLKD